MEWAAMRLERVVRSVDAFLLRVSIPQPALCYTGAVMKSALTNDRPNTIVTPTLTVMEARHVLSALRANVLKQHCGVCADLALMLEAVLFLDAEKESPCGAAGMNGQPRPRRRH
jgi:hypothetical protein